MMRAAVFAPAHNKAGKKDATGAFQPEATRFCQVHNVADKVHLIDNQGDALEQREAVYSAFDRSPADTFEAVAFFCHGWRTGLQFGFGLEHITALAIRIKQSGVRSGPRVILYACDAGRDRDADREDDRNDYVGGDGGFADRLRDQLNAIGCPATVWAHSTEGHTTWNPYLRVFRAGESAGGKFLVAPGTSQWRAWCRAMRTTDLRFRFAWLSSEELRAELSR